MDGTWISSALVVQEGGIGKAEIILMPQNDMI
jgi:hypothetical protein